MAAKTRRRTPARKPPANRAARARPKQSAPLLAPGQGRDLFGLALCAIGLFSALVLYAGFDGALVGGRLRSALDQLTGRASVFVPLAALGVGIALLLHLDARRTRPFRLGAALLATGVLLLLSGPSLDSAAARDGAGLLGNGLHAALSSVSGEVGVTLVTVFLLAAGALLVSGASAGMLMRQGAQAARESARSVARTTTVSMPGRGRDDVAVGEPPRRRVREAVDAERSFPDVVAEGAPAVPLDAPVVPEAEPEPPLGDTLGWPHESPDTPEPEAAHGDAAHGDEVEPPYEPEDAVPYVLPDPSVLRKGGRSGGGDADAERVSRVLLGALAEHGVEARLVGTVSGPRVTRYELQLAPGTKVSRVSSLRDDLAYALATTELRILAPIPGKQAVGVEVPNRSPNIVTLGDLVGEMPAGSTPLTVWLGKDIAGHTVTADLTRMPHMLIAGTTGSGKSGCINAMLCSILLRASPSDVQMILIDPKKVELNHYETIPHLRTPVVTNMKNAAAVLGNVVREMESRYELMGIARARNLIELNRVRARERKPPMPYLLVVIDELADLMMVSPAEVEDAVIRLAQKSRAVGIHLLLATQRPSVDVITGMIKANVPSRIAFAVSSQTDSRVILDTAGAESLLGQGDMLYKPLGTSRLQRVQGAYVSEEEIALLVEQCRRQGEPEFDEELLEQAPDVEPEELDPDEDPLLEDAILCVAQHETASVSLIQRRLRVGYTRAGRLIDMLERRGVISGYEGSKPRRVLVSYDEAQRIAGRDGVSVE